METDVLSKLSKEQLEELVRTYARNMLALDGVWFQSVERELGMDRAMRHDERVWQAFTQTEARRIKGFLQLPDRPGLDGLERALSLRFAAFANRQVELIRESDSLTFRVVDCRVQSARKRKRMPLHPCLSVGIREYAFFAKTIDDRIVCEPVSCFPRVSDPGCARGASRWGIRKTDRRKPRTTTVKEKFNRPDAVRERGQQGTLRRSERA